MNQSDAEQIVEMYGDMVFRLALAMTRHDDVAQDVVQDVFLRYLKKQPIFESEQHAKAWFLVVCKNCCRNHFMSGFVRHTTSLQDDIPMLQEEDYGIYYEVLKLPKKYRLLIHLFYYEGYSSKEIAALLHKKDATIRTQLKRARDVLKQQMEGSVEFEELQQSKR